MKQQQKARRWAFTLYSGNCKDTNYLTWVKTEVIGNDVVLLAFNKEVLPVAEQEFPNCPVETYFKPSFDPVWFDSVLDRHNINSFFSHAKFDAPILGIRKHLLKHNRFEKTLAVWHEGRFLRSDASRSCCIQLDWMGWNALSSMAAIDWSKIPDLVVSEQRFIHEYMQRFLDEKKVSHEQINNKSHLQEICGTTKPIVVVPLQVYTDSVIRNFVPKGLKRQSLLFDFAESRPDCFFVFKEHPKQRKNAPHRSRQKRGKNYVYLGATEYDTISMCVAANIVLVLNSTVGFESLYWTPVVRLGRSAYSRDYVSYSFREFRADLPMKPRKNLQKFLYYAVTKFHYSPEINASTYQEWFNFIDAYRFQHRELIANQNRMLLGYPR